MGQTACCIQSWFVGLTLLTGCVGPASYQGVPDDFSLDVALLPAQGGPAAQSRHFVLHPDGSLRAGQARQGAADFYPGQARKLSAMQMAELLTLARQALSSIEPVQSLAPRQWAYEAPGVDGPSLLLWVRDSGREQAARFDTTDGRLPQAASSLHERLAQLALMR